MILRDQLLLLRSAARSYTSARDPQECLRLIAQGSPFDQLFFSEVTDPLWLSRLKNSSFFSKLPETHKDADGKIRFPRHLPLFGLKRLANSAPEMVTQILESLELPNNPAISDQIMQVIAAVDSAQFFIRLGWTLQRVLEKPSFDTVLWLDDILLKWLNAGATTACFVGLMAFLKAAIAPTDGQSNRANWSDSEIDSQIIAPLATQHPMRVAHLLVDTLSTSADLEKDRISKSDFYYLPGNHSDIGPDYDHPPTYWLQDFESQSMGDHALEGVLTCRLYVIGKQLFETADLTKITEYDELLRQDRWLLFRRLRWQLYGEFPSITLNWARQELIERISQLGNDDLRHRREFALMLRSHVRQHGTGFLSSSELKAFVDSVLAGPRDKNGTLFDDAHRASFQRAQLFPIHELLKAIAAEERLTELIKELEVDEPNYTRGFSGRATGGPVESVAPALADDLPAMQDAEIWRFLNAWEPSGHYITSESGFKTEDLRALGTKFAELVESNPERFLPQTRWWENLLRPVILSQLLERATVRLTSSTETNALPSVTAKNRDWQNSFGIASWIIEHNPSNALKKPSEENLAWSWARLAVVRFLLAAINVEPSIERASSIEAMLRKLVDDIDEVLDASPRAPTNDWLTTAINSVRGTAIEALLMLGLAEKNNPEIKRPESWIFDVIISRLRIPEESPAVFALIGARFRLVLHLFKDQLADRSDLLLPNDRPIQREAFISAHVVYDNPMSGILDTLPEFPKRALEYLESLTSQKDADGQDRGDFGGRLGTHLCFYYWNSAFSDQIAADSTLDRFFEVARPKTRGFTVGEICRTFSEVAPNDAQARLFELVMQLWDRRFSHIERAIESKSTQPADFHPELSNFLEWIKCECFPFEWRVNRVLKSISCISEAPRAYSIIETLESFTRSGERIVEALQILNALIAKPSDQLRWSYSENHLRPLLERGMESDNPEARRLAENTQELLLIQGVFEYLDIGAG